MNTIIEFIVLNRTALLVGTIIILLAIIGHYADKTNFGQGKKESKSTKPKEENEFIDKIEKVIEKEPVKEEKKKTKEVSKPKESPKQKKVSFEEKFSKFDKEFEALLPKRDVLSEDLISDIDNLSLERTQRINLSDIPDVDDVDLPRIKKLTKQDDDIWKL